MVQKEFKAESKRLLDMMINSIYTHKDIFLRELISNSSDAIDKMYYKELVDESLVFDKDKYGITIEIDKSNRSLIISDNGIGMTKDELENNLGTIAKSGTLQFKKDNELDEDHNVIGQFGVGFYSAFMVSDNVKVESKAFGASAAYVWESSGADGYTIEECDRKDAGTTITLTIKENTEDDSYEVYLTDYGIKEIVKKYSDFIKYPIKMEVEKSVLKEGSEDEYETHVEEITLNNMVPIWKKRKSELTDEDYKNFYQEKRYGFDNPMMHVHVKVDGLVRYNSIMFIPESMPFDYYSKEYEKGLELYANGVLIMNKCADLLPDYFSFVKGMVDSEDLSLNISRELLQHDRQLKVIAKNLKSKIKKELQSLLKDDREKYEEFFKVFGTQIKYGAYDNYGQDKEFLVDLLMFASSNELKLTTLEEYVARMGQDQEYIYYATGESLEKIDKMPQTEMLKDKEFEILYLTDQVDEFAIKVLANFEGKEFKSVSSSDLGFEEDTEAIEQNKTMLEEMTEVLTERVAEVKISSKLKSHPVCITNDGELSVEMEKILSQMPNGMDMKASKVLEINPDHEVFKALQNAFASDKEKFTLYTELLYSQALLIEGLNVNDPVEFSNNICKIMK